MMVLLPSIFIVIFSQPLYRWYAQPVASLGVKERWVRDSLVNTLEARMELNAEELPKFKFDPNSATLEEFKSLGIPEYVGKRIIQYKSKGGEFRIKSDLSKIYGLDSSLYRTLASFILLPDEIERETFATKDNTKFPIQYDLNLTDTTSLKTVNGIGPTLSNRIIKYRESLGGFTDIKQLKEVYGIDSAVFLRLSPFFVSEQFQPIKIKINTAGETEFAGHPYLSFKDARSIVTYRMQHGKISGLDGLYKIKTLQESTIARIGPYLSFE